MRDVNNSYNWIWYNQANPLVPNMYMFVLEIFWIDGIMRTLVGACISLKEPSVRGGDMGAPSLWFFSNLDYQTWKKIPSIDAAGSWRQNWQTPVHILSTVAPSLVFVLPSLICIFFFFLRSPNVPVCTLEGDEEAAFEMFLQSMA